MTAQSNGDYANIERARSALSYLDPTNRDVWVRAAMCIRDGFGDAGFEMWDAWGSQCDSHTASSAKSVWKSVKVNGKLKIASLFYDAKAAGWTDSTKYKKPTQAEIDARNAQAAERAKQLAAEEAEAHAAAAKRAQLIWDAAKPCETHPYLERKGVAAHDLRVGCWERMSRETGELITVHENALLVPIRDRKYNLHSLQAIFPSKQSNGRDKDYLAGGAKSGNIHVIGKPQQREGRPVFILAEGYATAASVHEATGHMVLVCFDKSGLMPVAKSLRERVPDAWIVIAADNDTHTEGNPGLTAARKVAAEVSCLVALPPPGDFNDLHLSQGLEVVAELIQAAFNVKPGCESLDQPDCIDDHMLSVTEPSDCGEILLPPETTQDSVALIYRSRYEGSLLYANGFDCWFKWDGARWFREETGLALDFIRRLARELNVENNKGPSTAFFCKGVETFVKVDRAFATEARKFDVDNYLLNTPAGTFDLRTNVMRPHDPLDRITKLTSVAPSSEGGERFMKFLDEITGGDKSLAHFLQVSLGACLSGAVENHWMLFWTGSGRNGKNTLGDLIMDVMGDYAKKVPSSTLMSKQHEDHPTEIANLQGARLVVSSEVEDGAHWNESRINELTGDQALTGRFMRGNFFEFKRTHKHLIYGNHRPLLRNVTDALKARIKIIPFMQSFIGREDSTLATKLRDESSFVLFWLLEGHAEWIASGCKLPTCEAIENESRDYFEAQSTVETWIRKCVTVIEDDGRGARSWPKARELYQDYRQWKELRGEYPVSQTRWGETMSKMFKKQTSDGVRYIGALLSPI